VTLSSPFPDSNYTVVANWVTPPGFPGATGYLRTVVISPSTFRITVMDGNGQPLMQDSSAVSYIAVHNTEPLQGP